MRLEQAFSLLTELERRQIATHLEWETIQLWPLIRQCLWFALLDEQPVPVPAPAEARSAKLVRHFRKAWRYLSGARDFAIPPASDAQLMFVSRPVYLQKTPGGKLFDRIVDPIIFARDAALSCEKFYVSPWQQGEDLQFEARCLLPARATLSVGFDPDGEGKLAELATQAGIDAIRFVQRCHQGLQAFSRWYATGIRLFSRRPQLQAIYLTSWYFPDMMGLAAAARSRGIVVIDVQHGKQGRYQGMYSGWGNIPSQGYEMMPDRFWCWGQPSCDHILASSPERVLHRPFVGGFPWLDYYRKHISTVAQDDGRASGKSKCVLVTTQPRQSANTEPLPEFIIDYLRSAPVDVHLVIRCHPNDSVGPDYCRQRLADIPAHLYSIDSGKSNLYDRLLSATHHITAYSSCCYEASVFGVPTLLFGHDARVIYAEEIESGEFSWTEGNMDYLMGWLSGVIPLAALKGGESGAYIESSLARVGELLARG